MKFFTTSTSLILSLSLFVINPSFGQFRAYSKVFSDNIKGGTTIFGNTLTHMINYGVPDTAKMNNNRADGNTTYGNDNTNIQFADVDGNTGIGAGTRNSSSADLTLPAGTNTIKLARLYWGARVKQTDFNITNDSFRTIKIKFNTTAAYTEYAAARLDKNSTGTGTNIVNQYQAYADITSFIQANGSGTYTVGNVAASVGPAGNGGNYAGWCIVVVYENTKACSFNSIRVYDGFQQVYDGGAAQISSVTLTGLNIPSGILNARDAKMGAMVWEGDANLKLDYLKINGNNFYNSLNAIDNPWNGTITDTGVHVSAKNPNYTNQMGIDIDQFYTGEGYGIQPGDSTVTLEFGTEADQYFPGLFTFQIKTKEPTVTVDLLVNDANNNHTAEANEELTYTLRGKNSGTGNAKFCVIIDTLPRTVTYIPGTLKIVTNTGVADGTMLTESAGDDQADFINNVIVFRVGNAASAAQGGILAPQENFEFSFKVRVNTPAANSYLTPVINIARITGFSDAGIKSTDDGTSILETVNGPLPVILKSFVASLTSDNKVQLNWAASMEINCSKYIIERSTDGTTFSASGSIAGSGNTSTERSYSFIDDLASFSSAVVYYRLKQIDFDGKSSFSKIISVRLNNNSSFIVSPNPFSSFVNLQINWSKNENTVVKVFTMAGKEMFTKNINLSKGNNNIQLAELSGFAAGNYLIQLNTATGKIVKQVTKL